MNRLQITFGMLFVVAFTPAVLAGLAWEKDHIKVTANASTAVKTVKVPFQNKGKTNVTIAKVQQSCSCAKTTLPKKTFSPGEKGHLDVIIDFGRWYGPETSHVRVTTDDDQAKKLVVEVLMPSPVEAVPRSLQWKVGDKIETKSVVLTAHTDIKTLNIQNVFNQNRLRFKAKIVRLDDRRMRLDVVPLATDLPAPGMTTLEIVIGSGKSAVRKSFRVNHKIIPKE